MSSALLRWISSKGWPSDGSMTAMLRPETDAKQALAIWFSCMGRYFARNPIAVLCWQKNCPLAHFLAALTAIFFAVFEAQAPGSRALEHTGLPWRCACPATHAPGAARAKPLAPPPPPPPPPGVRGRRRPGGRRFTSPAVESDHQRHDQQRHDVDDLDQRVDRRACRVFV